MGRGGVPNKVGGFISLKDYKKKVFLIGKNVTIFQFFQRGCYEKDLVSYCSNRLSAYSCVHWIDDVADSDAVVNWSAEETINSTIPLPIITEPAYVDVDSSCSLLSLYLNPRVQTTAQILLPALILTGLILASMTLVIMQKLCVLHRLCRYLSIIACLDLVELLCCGSELLCETFYNIKIISAFLFIQRSTCQILTLAYSALKHAQSALYIGLAIDNTRFILAPIKFYSIYRTEWTHNVCILCAVLVLTINAQYFWTFDVTVNDNTAIQSRASLKRTFECGFSTSLPPNPIFARFIWPLIDHLCGEVIPVLISCITIVLSLRKFSLGKLDPNDPHLVKISIDPILLIQCNMAFFYITISHSILSILRMLLYFTKYFIFLYRILKSPTGYRSNSIQNSFKQSSMLLDDTTEFKIQKNYSPFEIALEIFEYFVKICSLTFIILKFILLLCNVNSFRRKIYNWLPKKFLNFPSSVSSNGNYPLMKQENGPENMNLISFSI